MMAEKGSAIKGLSASLRRDDGEEEELHGILDQVYGLNNILLKRIERRLKLLEEKEAFNRHQQEKMEKCAAASKRKITFDVGGKKFSTSKDTLLRYPNSYFASIVRSDVWEPDEDGSYFIDRNYKHFPLILDFMRFQRVPNFSKMSREEYEALKDDLDYYQLEIPLPSVDSLILDDDMCRTILEWTQAKELQLLYRYSKDGQTPRDFHRLCDNHNETITVIKSERGNVFGGFNPTNWNSTGNYKNVPGSWIFTLKNPHNVSPRQFICTNTSHAVYCNDSYFPTFGGGHDITNQNGSSYTSFPHSYQDNTGLGNNLFDGQRNFQVGELEVFKVLK